jgi:hypothetical protein
MRIYSASDAQCALWRKGLRNWTTILTAETTLAIIALIGTVVPTLRIAKIDPAKTLLLSSAVNCDRRSAT